MKGALTWSQASKGVWEKLLFHQQEAPQSRDRGNLNYGAQVIKAKAQFFHNCSSPALAPVLYKPCSFLGLAFLNYKAGWGKDSSHQFCETFSR